MTSELSSSQEPFVNGLWRSASSPAAGGHGVGLFLVGLFGFILIYIFSSYFGHSFSFWCMYTHSRMMVLDVCLESQGSVLDWSSIRYIIMIVNSIYRVAFFSLFSEPSKY